MLIFEGLTVGIGFPNMFRAFCRRVRDSTAIIGHIMTFTILHMFAIIVLFLFW